MIADPDSRHTNCRGVDKDYYGNITKVQFYTGEMFKYQYDGWGTEVCRRHYDDSGLLIEEDYPDEGLQILITYDDRNRSEEQAHDHRRAGAAVTTAKAGTHNGCRPSSFHTQTRKKALQHVQGLQFGDR